MTSKKSSSDGTWDYVVTISDIEYAIPVMVIAKNRAEYYKDRFNGSVKDSLEKDTIPLFKEDDYMIRDWAAGNMCWSEVIDYAVIINKKSKLEDPEEDWVNGDWRIREDEI